jgi:hypothetical protein
MPPQFQGRESPGMDKAKERRSTERIGLIDLSLIGTRPRRRSRRGFILTPQAVRRLPKDTLGPPTVDAFVRAHAERDAVADPGRRLAAVSQALQPLLRVGSTAIRIC